MNVHVIMFVSKIQICPEGGILASNSLVLPTGRLYFSNLMLKSACLFYGRAP